MPRSCVRSGSTPDAGTMTTDEVAELRRLLRAAEDEARARISNAVADRFAAAALVVDRIEDAP